MFGCVFFLFLSTAYICGSFLSVYLFSFMEFPSAYVTNKCFVFFFLSSFSKILFSISSTLYWMYILFIPSENIRFAHVEVYVSMCKLYSIKELHFPMKMKQCQLLYAFTVINNRNGGMVYHSMWNKDEKKKKWKNHKQNTNTSMEKRRNLMHHVKCFYILDTKTIKSSKSTLWQFQDGAFRNHYWIQYFRFIKFILR